MDTLASEDMRADEIAEWPQERSAAADLVGKHGKNREISHRAGMPPQDSNLQPSGYEPPIARINAAGRKQTQAARPDMFSVSEDAKAATPHVMGAEIGRPCRLPAPR